LSSSKARHCPHCHAAISRLDDVCPSCGERTGQRLPWYVYGLGAAMAVLMFLWLSDFQGLLQFVISLGRMFQS
jgi:hypothetical protein